MTLDLDTDNAPAGGELTAGATSGATQTGIGRDPRQRKAFAGSYSFDDPDRDLWDRDTELKKVFEYRYADGRYAYSKLKGERSDGRKAYLTGMLLSGSDLQIARQEWPREFYRFRGLEHYMKGAGDHPDLLFRYDDFEREKPARPAETLYLPEGEKDTDTLWELGLIATTNPNGALNYKSEFNPAFAGRNVVVLIDNDDKGKERGRRIKQELRGVAASVKVVLLPGLAPNKDVTDWLEAGKSKDDLLAAIEAAEEPDAPEQLSTDENGRPHRSIENARLALDLLGATVSYDDFAGRYLITGVPGFGPALDDAVLTRLRLRVEEEFRLAFGKERWGDIVTDHARNNSFHPVRDLLNDLRWDGVDRLDWLLPTYAGADDSEYIRAVGAICLIAAVRRVRDPGCKFDEMLVIEGEQGGNKSSALGLLAMREEWFADDLPLDADSKVLMERTAGRWIVELAELKGLRRGAVEHVKAMLSRRVDKARLAYGRMTTEQPRQCVFFGTTNDGQYLRDMTGNRRFWPVAVQRFDLVALRRDRDQLWAEAAAREAAGESIRLPERLWAVAGEQQAGREIGDPFHERLSERLDGHEGKVRAADVWDALGLGDIGRRTQDDNVRLSAAMQKLGWRRPKSKLRFGGSSPQHAWVKGEPGAALDAYVEVPRAVVLGSERPL